EGPAATGRIVRTRPYEVVTHGGGVVVDRPRAGLHVELRPRRARSSGLADEVVGPAGRDLDGLQAVGAHRLGDGVQRGTTVLGVAGEREEQQGRGDRNQRRAHTWLLVLAV